MATNDEFQQSLQEDDEQSLLDALPPEEDPFGFSLQAPLSEEELEDLAYRDSSAVDRPSDIRTELSKFEELRAEDPSADELGITEEQRYREAEREAEKLRSPRTGEDLAKVGGIEEKLRSGEPLSVGEYIAGQHYLSSQVYPLEDLDLFAGRPGYSRPPEVPAGFAPDQMSKASRESAEYFEGEDHTVDIMPGGGIWEVGVPRLLSPDAWADVLAGSTAAGGPAGSTAAGGSAASSWIDNVLGGSADLVSSLWGDGEDFQKAGARVAEGFNEGARWWEETKKLAPIIMNLGNPFDPEVQEAVRYWSRWAFLQADVRANLFSDFMAGNLSDSMLKALQPGRGPAYDGYLEPSPEPGEAHPHGALGRRYHHRLEESREALREHVSSRESSAWDLAVQAAVNTRLVRAYDWTRDLIGWIPSDEEIAEHEKMKEEGDIGRYLPFHGLPSVYQIKETLARAGLSIDPLSSGLSEDEPITSIEDLRRLRGLAENVAADEVFRPLLEDLDNAEEAAAKALDVFDAESFRAADLARTVSVRGLYDGIMGSSYDMLRKEMVKGSQLDVDAAREYFGNLRALGSVYSPGGLTEEAFAPDGELRLPGGQVLEPRKLKLRVFDDDSDDRPPPVKHEHQYGPEFWKLWKQHGADIHEWSDEKLQHYLNKIPLGQLPPSVSGPVLKHFFVDPDRTDVFLLQNFDETPIREALSLHKEEDEKAGGKSGTMLTKALGDLLMKETEAGRTGGPAVRETTTAKTLRIGSSLIQQPILEVGRPVADTALQYLFGEDPGPDLLGWTVVMPALRYVFQRDDVQDYLGIYDYKPMTGDEGFQARTLAAMYTGWAGAFAMSQDIGGSLGVAPRSKVNMGLGIGGGLADILVDWESAPFRAPRAAIRRGRAAQFAGRMADKGQKAGVALDVLTSLDDPFISTNRALTRAAEAQLRRGESPTILMREGDLIDDVVEAIGYPKGKSKRQTKALLNTLADEHRRNVVLTYLHGGTPEIRAVRQSPSYVAVFDEVMSQVWTPTHPSRATVGGQRLPVFGSHEEAYEWLLLLETIVQRQAGDPESPITGVQEFFDGFAIEVLGRDRDLWLDDAQQVLYQGPDDAPNLDQLVRERLESPNSVVIPILDSDGNRRPGRYHVISEHGRLGSLFQMDLEAVAAHVAGGGDRRSQWRAKPRRGPAEHFATQAEAVEYVHRQDIARRLRQREPEARGRVIAAVTGVHDSRPVTWSLFEDFQKAEAAGRAGDIPAEDVEAARRAVVDNVKGPLQDLVRGAEANGDYRVTNLVDGELEEGVGQFMAYDPEPNLVVEAEGDIGAILGDLAEYSGDMKQDGLLARVVNGELDSPRVLEQVIEGTDEVIERGSTGIIELPVELDVQTRSAIADALKVAEGGATVRSMPDGTTRLEIAHTREWDGGESSPDEHHRRVQNVAQNLGNLFGVEPIVRWFDEDIVVATPGVGAILRGQDGVPYGRQYSYDDDLTGRARTPAGDAPSPREGAGEAGADGGGAAAPRGGGVPEAPTEAVGVRPAGEAGAGDRVPVGAPREPEAAGAPGPGDRGAVGAPGQERPLGGERAAGVRGFDDPVTGRRFGLNEVDAEAVRPGFDPTPELARAVLARMGARFKTDEAGGVIDTTTDLKVYPLEQIIQGMSYQEVWDFLVAETRRPGSPMEGWSFRIFGPKFDADGNPLGGFQPPDFSVSYDQKTAWLFQPLTESGSFKDPQYTLAWRAPHEIAHGITNPMLTERYGGAGARAGALGIRAWTPSGRIADPLSLADALRAVEWEIETFKKQREILEAMGVRITDEQFAQENWLNTLDAVQRAITGKFSNPGEMGLDITRGVPSPDEAWAIARQTLRDVAQARRLDPAETFGPDLPLGSAPPVEISLRKSGYANRAEADAARDALDERIDSLTRSGRYYRGMTEAEYEATVGAEKGVQSRGDYSFSEEGTSFADDFGMAEDYVNFGRDDPRKTGRPNYVVEVAADRWDMTRNRQGTYYADKILPEQVTRVWRVAPSADGEVLLATEIDVPMPKGPEIDADLIDKPFHDLAMEQRGAAEQAMLDAASAVTDTGRRSSAAYAWALEHGGDLIHRMAERPLWHEGQYGAVLPKVRNLASTLSNKVDRRNWAAMWPALQADETVGPLLAKYVEEHKKLTPYNEVQRLANEVAIALGEGRFDAAEAANAKLFEYLKEGPTAWSHRAMDPGTLAEDLPLATGDAPMSVDDVLDMVDEIDSDPVDQVGPGGKREPTAQRPFTDIDVTEDIGLGLMRGDGLRSVFWGGHRLGEVGEDAAKQILEGSHHGWTRGWARSDDPKGEHFLRIDEHSLLLFKSREEIDGFLDELDEVAATRSADEPQPGAPARVYEPPTHPNAPSSPPDPERVGQEIPYDGDFTEPPQAPPPRPVDVQPEAPKRDLVYVTKEELLERGPVEIKADIQTDLARQNAMLGHKLYAGKLATVVIKELSQNSWDAIKGAEKLGIIEPGAGVLRVTTDPVERLVIVEDNGIGMPSHVMQSSYIDKLGSVKPGLDVSDSSGGFGMAKEVFQQGPVWLEVISRHDGVESVIRGWSEDFAQNRIKVTSRATDKPNGTRTTVKIGETNERGNKIWMPNATNTSFLSRPLLGDLEIRVSSRPDPEWPWIREVDGKVLPNGKHIWPEAPPLFTKATTQWGDIYIFIGKKKYDDPADADHQVLSAGVHQFHDKLELQGQKIPYDIWVDVRPGKAPADPDYPFRNNREGWSNNIKADVKALHAYIAGWYHQTLSTDVADMFTNAVSMRRVDSGVVGKFKPQPKKPELSATERAELDEWLRKWRENPRFEDGNIETDGETRITKEQIKQAEKTGKPAIEKTFEAEREVKPGFKREDDVRNPKDPLFLNNTDFDPFEAAEAAGYTREDAESFFSLLGSVVVEYKERVARFVETHRKFGDLDNPQKPYMAGISLDADYLGVHVRTPYNAFFLNPLKDKKGFDPDSAARSDLLVLAHEAAHTVSMRHDTEHSYSMLGLMRDMRRNGDLQLIEQRLTEVYTNNWGLFESMVDAYDSQRISNVGKSLRDQHSDEAFADTPTGQVDLGEAAEGVRAGAAGQPVGGRRGDPAGEAPGVARADVPGPGAERGVGPAGERDVGPDPAPGGQPLVPVFYSRLDRALGRVFRRGERVGGPDLVRRLAKDYGPSRSDRAPLRMEMKESGLADMIAAEPDRKFSIDEIRTRLRELDVAPRRQVLPDVSDIKLRAADRKRVEQHQVKPVKPSKLVTVARRYPELQDKIRSELGNEDGKVTLYWGRRKTAAGRGDGPISVAEFWSTSLSPEGARAIVEARTSGKGEIVVEAHEVDVSMVEALGRSADNEVVIRNPVMPGFYLKLREPWRHLVEDVAKAWADARIDTVEGLPETLVRTDPDVDVTPEMKKGAVPTKVAIVKTAKDQAKRGLDMERWLETLDRARSEVSEPLASPTAWSRFQAWLTGKNTAIKIPYRAAEISRRPQLINDIRARLTDRQNAAVDGGMEMADGFRLLLERGDLGPEHLAEIAMWSSLSAGRTAFAHESGFIDAMLSSVPELIERALRDGWDDELEATAFYLVNGGTPKDYAGWLRKNKKPVPDKIPEPADLPLLPQRVGAGEPYPELYPKRVSTDAARRAGTPDAVDFATEGGAVKQNLNRFLHSFLPFAATRLPEGHPYAGARPIDLLMGWMADPKMTGREIRRRWMVASAGVGTGVDLKLLSFLLIVTGRHDVIVLDRVQYRHMWDAKNRAEEYGFEEIYEGGLPQAARLGKTARPWSPSKGLAEMASVRELALYEAIEEALLEAMQAAGIKDPNLGRFHWETWILEQPQEAGHGSLAAIQRAAAGEERPFAGLSATESRMDSYGFRSQYVVADDGVTRFYAVEVPGGDYVYMSGPNYQRYRDALRQQTKSDNNSPTTTQHRVVHRGFKIQKPPPHEVGIPWFEREGVDQAALRRLAKHFESEGFAEQAGLHAAAHRERRAADAVRGDGPELVGRDRPDLAPAPEGLRGVRGGPGPRRGRDPRGAGGRGDHDGGRGQGVAAEPLKGPSGELHHTVRERIRGQFEFEMPTAQSARTAIKLFRTGDLQTLFHETGHLATFLLGKTEAQRLFRHFDHTVLPDGTLQLTRLGEEQAAESFRWYLKTQRSSSSWLARKWSEVKWFLKHLWLKMHSRKGSFGGQNLVLLVSPDVRAFWDDVLDPTTIARRDAEISPRADAQQRYATYPRNYIDPLDPKAVDREQTLKQQRAYAAKRIDLRPEVVRTATGLLGNEPIDPITLYSRAIGYVATERMKRLFGQRGIGSSFLRPTMDMVPLTPRTSVPKSRKERVLSTVNRRLSKALGRDAREVLRTQVAADDTIALDMMQQAGMEHLLDTLLAHPMGQILPRRLHEWDRDLSALTPEEYNRIYDVLTDVEAGPGANHNMDSSRIEPTLGLAVWRALRDYDAAYKSDKQHARLASGLMSLLQKVFVVKHGLEGRLGPNVIEIMERTTRRLVGIEIRLRQAAKSIADAEAAAGPRGPATESGEHAMLTLRSLLQEVRSQLVPPVPLEVIDELGRWNRWRTEGTLNEQAWEAAEGTRVSQPEAQGLSGEELQDIAYEMQAERDVLRDQLPDEPGLATSPDVVPSDRARELTEEMFGTPEEAGQLQDLFDNLDRLNNLTVKLNRTEDLYNAIDTLYGLRKLLYDSRTKQIPVELGALERMRLASALHQVNRALENADTAVRESAEIFTRQYGIGSGSLETGSLKWTGDGKHHWPSNVYKWVYGGDWTSFARWVSSTKSTHLRVDEAAILIALVRAMMVRSEYSSLAKTMTDLGVPVRLSSGELDVDPSKVNVEDFRQRVEHHITNLLDQRHMILVDKVTGRILGARKGDPPLEEGAGHPYAPSVPRASSEMWQVVPARNKDGSFKVDDEGNQLYKQQLTERWTGPFSRDALGDMYDTMALQRAMEIVRAWGIPLGQIVKTKELILPDGSRAYLPEDLANYMDDALKQVVDPTNDWSSLGSIVFPEIRKDAAGKTTRAADIPIEELAEPEAARFAKAEGPRLVKTEGASAYMGDALMASWHTVGGFHAFLKAGFLTGFAPIVNAQYFVAVVHGAIAAVGQYGAGLAAKLALKQPLVSVEAARRIAESNLSHLLQRMGATEGAASRWASWVTFPEAAALDAARKHAPADGIYQALRKPLEKLALADGISYVRGRHGSMSGAIMARMWSGGASRAFEANAPPTVTPYGKIYTVEMVANLAVEQRLNQSFVTSLFSTDLARQIKMDFPGFWNNAKYVQAHAQQVLFDAIESVDTYYRVGVFRALLEDGFSPHEAGRIARRTVLDYQNMTDTEKFLSKWAVFFYSYMKQIGVLTIDTLLRNPSRMMAILRFARDFNQVWYQVNPDMYQREYLHERQKLYYFDLVKQTQRLRGYAFFSPPTGGMDVLTWMSAFYGLVSTGDLSKLRTFASMANPALQGLFGAAFQIDTFTGQPLQGKEVYADDWLMATSFYLFNGAVQSLFDIRPAKYRGYTQQEVGPDQLQWEVGASLGKDSLAKKQAYLALTGTVGPMLRSIGRLDRANIGISVPGSARSFVSLATGMPEVDRSGIEGIAAFVAGEGVPTGVVPIGPEMAVGVAKGLDRLLVSAGYRRSRGMTGWRAASEEGRRGQQLHDLPRSLEEAQPRVGLGRTGEFSWSEALGWAIRLQAIPTLHERRLELSNDLYYLLIDINRELEQRTRKYEEPR